jgi:aquaporin Z
MKKYVVELLGTFFIVFTVGLGSNPLSVGFAYIAMIYIGFNISGSHYNPVISAIMFLKKKIDIKDFILYIVFQIID